jgi:hypothetical protein
MTRGGCGISFIERMRMEMRFMMVFSGWCLTYLATGDPAAAWRVLRFWIPMMILAPPGCMVAAWLAAKEYGRSRDWTSLEIAD